MTRLVVARRRAREAVVRDAEVAQVLADERVVAVGELTRRHALPVGGDHHRRAVLVRPADHQDVVALQPVVAREHVRRHGEARHVADVARAARVRPRGRDEDLLGQRLQLLRCSKTGQGSYERARQQSARERGRAMQPRRAGAAERARARHGRDTSRCGGRGRRRIDRAARSSGDGSARSRPRAPRVAAGSPVAPEGGRDAPARRPSSDRRAPRGVGVGVGRRLDRRHRSRTRRPRIEVGSGGATGCARFGVDREARRLAARNAQARARRAARAAATAPAPESAAAGSTAAPRGRASPAAPAAPPAPARRTADGAGGADTGVRGPAQAAAAAARAPARTPSGSR